MVVIVLLAQLTTMLDVCKPILVQGKVSLSAANILTVESDLFVKDVVCVVVGSEISS
jgi:hypothetical protein